MIDRTEVEKAIKKAVEEGWKLRSNITLDKDKRCCCPMGAVALLRAEQLRDMPRAAWRRNLLGAWNGLLWAAELLGTSLSEVEDFALGFDDQEVRRMSSIEHPDAYKLGLEFRALWRKGKWARSSNGGTAPR